MTILFRAPQETLPTGASTPCRAAASAPTSQSELLDTNQFTETAAAETH
ncbi:hypothetical protein [Streptomyces sp. NPDC088254]